MKTKFALFVFCFFIAQLKLAGQQNCFEDCWETLAHTSKDNLEEAFRFPYQQVMAYLEGCPMPAFYYHTIDGEEISPEALKGKIVVMNFWFESCTPCRNELPGLNKLAGHFSGKEVVFIAFGRDPETSIRGFLQRNEFDFKHVADSFNAGVFDCLCVMSGFPTTFVFDKNGVLIHSVRGGSVDPAKQFEIFEKLQPVIEACF